MNPLPSKPCARCGRTFDWRKKWERDWDQVRFCSKACRRAGLRPIDERLESAMLELLGQGTGSICPSEVARRVGEETNRDPRTLLEPTRMAARRLHRRGKVILLKAGRPIDPDAVRGPIRIGLPT